MWNILKLCLVFFSYVYSCQVQSDHFEEFFAPELDKHGYQALFKRKTAEVATTSLESDEKLVLLLMHSLLLCRFLAGTLMHLTAALLSSVGIGFHM